MWPQSFNCGNSPSRQRRSPLPSRLQCGRSLSTAEIHGSRSHLRAFRTLQCGRSLSTAEMPVIMINIFPPSCSLQCGRSLSTAEIYERYKRSLQSHHRFNVAAVFQLRKSTGAVPSFVFILPGFNVAAVFQLRKSLVRAAEQNPALLLQCGRSLSTAEIRGPFLYGSLTMQASMWPQSFNCGNEGAHEGKTKERGSFNVAAVFQLRK